MFSIVNNVCLLPFVSQPVIIVKIILCTFFWFNQPISIVMT